MDPSIQTIDLTPTTDGYANMALYFAKAVMDDARRERQHDTGHLLSSFADILVHLSHQPHFDMTALLADIKREAARPKSRARDEQ